MDECAFSAIVTRAGRNRGKYSFTAGEVQVSLRSLEQVKANAFFCPFGQ